VAYNLGHYDDAAQHYEAAYTLVQDSAFLFNIAQSYRMGGKLDQALDRYRAFLRTTSADAPNRDTADKFVAEIKRKLEEKKEVAASAPAEPAPVAPAPPATEPSRTTPLPAMAVPIPPPVDSSTNLTSAPAAHEQTSSNQPVYKTWWFWTGIGAVVVAGTVTAFLLTRHSSSPCSGTDYTCVEVR
jgi:tetratricopeptide (TPR) repeat protein